MVLVHNVMPADPREPVAHLEHAIAKSVALEMMRDYRGDVPCSVSINDVDMVVVIKCSVRDYQYVDQCVRQARHIWDRVKFGWEIKTGKIDGNA